MSKANASPIFWQKISQEGPAETIQPAHQTSQISAIVGQGALTIKGNTFPSAIVILTNSQGNLGVKTTQANQEGYFVFTNVALPKKPGELWLQAIDKQNNADAPLALPQPPLGATQIDGIILSPIFAQTNNRIIKKSDAFAWGYGTPNSQIEINLFKIPRFSLLKQVFAQQPLKFKISTNSSGYFNFNLPNQTLARYKAFAGNIFQDNYSPKSVVLSVTVIAWWENIWQQIISLAIKLTLGLWTIMHNLLFWIGVEIAIIILLIEKNRRQNRISNFKF